MHLQKIKYQEGWLYVDKGAEIEVGNFFYTPHELLNVECNYDISSHVPIEAVKIVAQSPNLSLPNIPYVEDIEEDELAKKWSDEDMKNAYLEACGYHTNDDGSGYKSYEEFEASLQPKIKSVEIEMDYDPIYGKRGAWTFGDYELATKVPVTYQKEVGGVLKTFLKVKI